MHEQLLKDLLSRLNKNAFISLIKEIHKYDLRDFSCTPIFYPEIGEGVHSVLRGHPYRLTKFMRILVFPHYIPIELFREPHKVDIADPIIVDQLQKFKNIYEELKGRLEQGKQVEFGYVGSKEYSWFEIGELDFHANFAGIGIDEYQSIFLPKYQELVKRFGWEGFVDAGSLDIYTEFLKKELGVIFKEFISTHKDGLSIDLSTEQVRVDRFSAEKSILSGVLKLSKSPCEPLFIFTHDQKEQVLEEFESLIQKKVTEAELESFLTRYYKEVFGLQYDRIETQLWLRFPELDISGKNRRLDIFLRNSVEHDWELFEIKRVINLTSTYRDVPVLAHEIMSAIQQLRNYASILAQDVVRARFAKEGIEYYYPSLRLVVGKRPQIPLKQWRWLKASNEKDLKIITFDDLLDEMRLRLQHHYQFGIDDAISA